MAAGSCLLNASSNFTANIRICSAICGSAVSFCWAKAGKAKLIANPTRHRNLDGSHYFSGLHPKYRESKDAVALRVDQGFHEPARLGKSSGAQHRHHWNFGQPIGDSVVFRLPFAQADSGQFGVGEHAERHLPSGSHPLAAGKIVPNNSKIIESNMRKLRATRAFTYCPDVRRCRLEPFIDFNVTGVRQFHSSQLQANTGGVGSAADCYQKMCSLQNQFRSALDQSKFHRVTGLTLQASDPGT